MITRDPTLPDMSLSVPFVRFSDLSGNCPVFGGIFFFQMMKLFYAGSRREISYEAIEPCSPPLELEFAAPEDGEVTRRSPRTALSSTVCLVASFDRGSVGMDSREKLVIEEGKLVLHLGR